MTNKSGWKFLRSPGFGVLWLIFICLSGAATAQSVTEFPATPGGMPGGIATGPDGNLWFTEAGVNRIGMITPAGVITEFGLATASATPNFITVGPDGALWFSQTGTNRIGRISTMGSSPSLRSRRRQAAQ
jgi:streptogramin lyase